MHYANMMEETNVKKTFIIATLINSIIGTFTTGMNLCERMGEKMRQKQTKDVRRQRGQPVNQSRRAVDRRRTDIRDDDVKDSLERGRLAVRREYDMNYRRFGDRFAEGDAITQNELRRQILTLQSNVIGLLEDAIHTGHIADINRLYNASELARDGSIAALQQQYQRMLEAAPLRQGIRPPLPTPARSQPGLTPNSDSSKVREVYHDDVDVAAARTFSAEGPLFCRYAASLQNSPRASLGLPLATGGYKRCPECSAHVVVEQGQAWKIVKEEIVHEQIEQRTYLLSNRFVVKCHRERVGFACLLCARFRDRDTILESAQGLVRHVWRRHDVNEYEVEPDIWEVEYA